MIGIIKKPIYLFLLVLVLLYVVIYTIPKLTGMLERTEILEPGTIQVMEPATCYFVRTEQVYSAADRGKLTYLAKEGIHIRKGSKVLKLSPKQPPDPDKKEEPKYLDIIERLGKKTIADSKYKAQSSGILSYYVDGYEYYFRPETMKKLKYESVRYLNIKPMPLTRKLAIKKEPLYKICDNDNWYLVCWVESGSAAYYEQGHTVTIQLPDGEVKATVEEINRAGDRLQVIFRSNRYYKTFATSRIADGEIISKEYAGLIVSNGSLTSRNGKAGLMVKQQNGKYEFVRVKAIINDGEYTVLEDISFIDEDGNRVNTVKVYDEVLKHPGEGK